jgi:hypothetical protein
MNAKSKTTKAKTAAPIFASRLAVIADESIAWGQTVKVERENDTPEDYTKTPQDDPNAIFGAVFTTPAGLKMSKNAPVEMAHAAMTKGRGDFTAQDAANACANAPAWVRVSPDSGAIVLGNDRIHGRAFHVKKNEDLGWCFLNKYAGLGRNRLTQAPYLRLRMNDPEGRSAMQYDAKGDPKGMKHGQNFEVAIFNLEPCQKVEGCSGVPNPTGEVMLSTAAKLEKLLKKEAKRAAGTGAAATAAVDLPPAFNVWRVEADHYRVTHNEESGIELPSFEPEEFTGNDARANALTRARILENQVRGL